MQQVITDMPLWAWTPGVLLLVFLAFIGYRMYKANVKPKGKGGSGVGGSGTGTSDQN